MDVEGGEEKINLPLIQTHWKLDDADHLEVEKIRIFEEIYCYSIVNDLPLSH
jgi:hypothetical protein